MDITPESPPTRVAWRAARRGTPWFGHAIAGGGGALVAIGLIAIGADVYPDRGDGPGWVGALLCVALIIASYLAFTRVPDAVRAACVAGISIGIGAAIGFLVIPGVERVSDLRPFFAATIVSWLLACALGPARGRTLLLGLALLMALTWAITEVADVPTTPLPFAPFVTFDSTTQFDGSFTPEVHEPNWGELGVVCVSFAAVYLLGVAVLDTRGRRGVATAAVVPGVIALVLAVIFFATEAESVVVAGLASVTAGLFCGTVGAQSHRRFTVWTGAFLATVGALLLTGKIADATTGDGGTDNAVTIFGLCTIAFGALMVGIALAVARLLREPPGGDDEPTALASAASA